MQRRAVRNSLSLRLPSETNILADVKPIKQSKNNICTYLLIAAGVCYCLFVLPIAYLLFTRFGIGSKFPAQPNFLNAKPLLPESALKIVAELPLPPGNIAVSAKGRIFFNFHPEFDPKPIKVAELSSVDSYTPFPNLAFQDQIMTCLSMRIDKQNRLWLLDFANHGIMGDAALYGFKLKSSGNDKLVKNYTFPASVAGFGSMLNDFQVDPSGKYIYIIDTSIIATTPALIVYSVNHDLSYRILSSDPTMFGTSAFLSVGRHQLKFGPLGIKIHADSIALDRSGSTLYYGAVTSDKLFSVSTSHLLYYVHKAREETSRKMLHALNDNVKKHVRQVCGNKPATDGMSTDARGNLWMTSFEHSAIAVATPANAKKTESAFFGVSDEQTFEVIKVVQSTSLLRWPDGLSFGPDGLYITNSALHLKMSGAVRNISEAGPFHILKLPTNELKKAQGSGKRTFKFDLPFSGH